MGNVDLCNDGECHRVRMGKNRHEKDNFSNQYLKKEKKITGGLGLISGLLMVVILLIYFTQPEMSQGAKWTVIIGVFAALVTLLVSVTNIIVKNKQLQTSSMFKVFELLASPEIRKSRKAIHEKYNDIKEGKKIFTGTDTEKDADIVISSFDQVSAIVLNKLLDKDLFFDTYADMIVRDWKTLKDEIEFRQNKNKKTMRHFTFLKNEFENLLKEDPKYKDSDTDPY